MPDLPNIVLLMPDQWRGDWTGAAGHPVVRTPNYDDHERAEEFGKGTGCVSRPHEHEVALAGQGPARVAACRLCAQDAHGAR